MTFVLFFPDGTCGLVRTADGRLELPTGELGADEDELDAVLRIPLMSAGFRSQRFHPFRWDGDHLYAWVEGDRYDGHRPHRKAPLEVLSAEDAARRLRAQGCRQEASRVAAAARSYRSQTEAAYYAESIKLLEEAYLKATTAEGGSGFSGTPEEWRAQREPVVAGIEADGTFLDAGCANGLLMESAQAWCAERGVSVEPYGIDLAPGLIELARRRLPHWAERLWVGNAITWRHPGGVRFDYVHVLLDAVPAGRRRGLVVHALQRLVAPGGRLLVSQYPTAGSRGQPVPEALAELGFTVGGVSPPYTAWVDRA